MAEGFVRRWRTQAFLLWLTVAHTAHAVTTVYVDNPAGWRMQTYKGDQIVLYFTAAPGCAAGEIYMHPDLTLSDKDRLWATILTAKSLNKAVGLVYDQAGGTCNVVSFFAP